MATRTLSVSHSLEMYQSFLEIAAGDFGLGLFSFCVCLFFSVCFFFFLLLLQPSIYKDSSLEETLNKAKG